MPELSAPEKLVKLLRGLGSYKAFRGLIFTMDRMRRLNQFYQNYPEDPPEFSAWKKRVDSVLQEVRHRFN
jgi:hypothetical protein